MKNKMKCVALLFSADDDDRIRGKKRQDYVNTSGDKRQYAAGGCAGGG